ncbi:uncharacterized protein LOC111713816 [Eurytemora carolleeae]|uniref:uncharacterized protein LOC111713816 n=1 Tax=Eurytemora carolleeae TaxID=1294199 RepID=UPI000C75C4AC|nr:uncharacterized protein LOC111713816 [Eurytemora carolleeae]|eukprot:XP_023344532.1 uncharacterized protein LOC111713816 [Eurytemora affinis]
MVRTKVWFRLLLMSTLSFVSPLHQIGNKGFISESQRNTSSHRAVYEHKLNLLDKFIFQTYKKLLDTVDSVKQETESGIEDDNALLLLMILLINGGQFLSLHGKGLQRTRTTSGDSLSALGDSLITSSFSAPRVYSLRSSKFPCVVGSVRKLGKKNQALIYPNIIYRDVFNMNCSSFHPYRLLRPNQLPDILNHKVEAFTRNLSSVLSCIILETGTKITGLINLLGETIRTRLRVTQELLDLVTHDYVFNC